MVYTKAIWIVLVKLFAPKSLTKLGYTMILKIHLHSTIQSLIKFISCDIFHLSFLHNFLLKKQFLLAYPYKIFLVFIELMERQFLCLPPTIHVAIAFTLRINVFVQYGMS